MTVDDRNILPTTVFVKNAPRRIGVRRDRFIHWMIHRGELRLPREMQTFSRLPKMGGIRLGRCRQALLLSGVFRFQGGSSV